MAAIDIETLAVLAGAFPPAGLRLVVEWAGLHHAELSDNWERARHGEKLRRIAPLP